jgi:hypothetical protein
MIEVHCKECNKVFEQKRYWQKFCSPVCRTKQSLRIQKEDIARGRALRNTVAPPNRNSDLFSGQAA